MAGIAEDEWDDADHEKGRRRVVLVVRDEYAIAMTKQQAEHLARRLLALAGELER
jgi:hypothetical protein